MQQDGEQSGIVAVAKGWVSETCALDDTATLEPINESGFAPLDPDAEFYRRFFLGNDHRNFIAGTTRVLMLLCT